MVAAGQPDAAEMTPAVMEKRIEELPRLKSTAIWVGLHDPLPESDIRLIDRKLQQGKAEMKGGK